MGKSFAELSRQRREGVIRQSSHLRIERIGSVDEATVLTQEALVAATENRLQKLEHGSGSLLATALAGAGEKSAIVLSRDDHYPPKVAKWGLDRRTSRGTP